MLVRYTVSRVLVSLPILLGLVILTFFYVHVLPGDPVTAMLGVNQDPALIADLRHKLGLDKSVVVQFWAWFGDLAHADLGISYSSERPVTELIVGRLPATIELAVAAFVIMLAVGIPAGLLAGMRPGSRIDHAINMTAIVGLAIPGFFVGMLLLVALSLTLRVLPSQGYVEFAADPLGNLSTLCLPAITLGISNVPYLVRLVRLEVREVMAHAYVPYARGKGLPNGMITRRYVIRNVAPRLVTIISLTIGGLLGGSIIVESLFGWPGMGQLVASAVSGRDYGMIQAAVLLYGMIFVVFNLAGEILQAALDPTIRLQ